MDLIRIPNPSELPQTPDPLNLVRQKVADEIRRASVYQKHASIVFKQDPLFSKEQWHTTSRNFGYKEIIWDLDMFEKIKTECLEKGYVKVNIEKGSKTIRYGQYGVNVCNRIIFYISWDVDSSECGCK